MTRELRSHFCTLKKYSRRTAVMSRVVSKPGSPPYERVFNKIKNLLWCRADGIEEVALSFVKHRLSVLLASAVGLQAILEQFAQSLGPVVIVHGANKAQIREKLQASTSKFQRGSKRRRFGARLCESQRYLPVRKALIHFKDAGCSHAAAGHRPALRRQEYCVFVSRFPRFARSYARGLSFVRFAID